MCVVLGTDPRASCMLGKWSATELYHPSPFILRQGLAELPRLAWNL